MYIFKNALTNISRNKMRNILLGLIFIVIASILLLKKVQAILLSLMKVKIVLKLTLA